MSVERVGIQLELETTQDIEGTLKRIEDSCNKIGGKRTKVRLDDGDIVSVEEAIKRLEDRLKVLRAAKKLDIISDDELAELSRVNAQLDMLKRGLKNGTMGARSLKQEFKSMSSAIAHAGGAMQSMGNALTRLTNPFGRVATGALMGIGYKAINAVTTGLESGFERADVMRKYPRIMAAMGYSADEAQKSIEALNAAVEGLPTSLVEMVSMAQRFTSTVGDMNKGTKLAIATNNAFLASMSSETQRYQAMMQLQDVIGGKDMTAKEWQSLANAMMPAIRMIGESLGKTGQELDEYVAAVQRGEIANEEFLDALVKAGADPEGKIRQIAMESLDTWEAFFSRIRTASSKLMYKGIIEPMNEIVKTVTNGKFESVNLLLDDFIYNGIDRMSDSIRKWIAAHPEEITEFFRTMASMDWKGLAQGIAEGMIEVAKAAKMLLEAFGGDDLKWLGKWAIRLRIAGKALTVFGGVVKGLRHIIPAAYVLGTALGRIFKGTLKGGGLIKSLIEGLIGKGKLPAFDPKSTIEAVKNIGLICAAIAGVAVTGVVTFKSFKSMVKDLGVIVDEIKDIDWEVGAQALTGMVLFLGVFKELGTLVGRKGMKSALTALKGEAIVGAMTTFAAAIAAADMALFKSAFSNFKAVTEHLKTALTNLKDIKGIKVNRKDLEGTLGALNTISGVFNGNAKLDREGFKPIDPEISKGLISLGAVMKSIATACKSVDEMSGVTVNTDNLDEVMSGLEEATLRVGRMLDIMPTSFTRKGYAAGNMSGIFDNIKRAANSVKSLGEVALDNSVIESVKKTVAAVGDIAKDVDSLLPSKRRSANLEQSSTGLANALYQIRRMAYSINQLAGTDINTSGFSALIGQLKTALEELKGISGDLELDIRVKMSTAFEDSVKAVIRRIKQGKRDIKAQNKPISLRIPVVVTFSVSTNLGAALSIIWSAIASIRAAASSGGSSSAEWRQSGNGWSRQGESQRAMGGPIYRALGGGVPFPGKPIGTDVVPTWTTPGEFIQNRRAVNLFGIDFMRKVNNLDVKGAMNELMMRAGNIVGAGQSTTINNYYNNNQKVVQNINTNSPDFAFRTASRFVGAF